jgi:uncharacterized iron-regulated membrane protein
MRKWLLNLHLYVALVAAAFLLILGITGSIMAFEGELDHFSNPSLFYVQPQAGPSLPIASLVDRVRQKYPGEEIGGIELSQRPDESFVVETSARAVFINGYTGEILGMRDGPTLLDYVHQLHIRLMFGQGKTIVGLAGIAMFFLVLSGIMLWWRQKRLTIKWNGTSFRTMFDLHTVTGIYSALFLLFLSGTGIVIAYEGSIFPWLYKTTNTQPIRRGYPSTVQEGVKPIGPEHALAIATAEIQGAAPIAIALPLKPKDSYTIRMRFPEDLTPGGRSWVCVDQYSGKVLVAQNSRTAPGPTRAQILNRAIHTGDIFGVFSKIVLSLSSLLVVVQALSGISMWLKRPKPGTKNGGANDRRNRGGLDGTSV